ncbi:MAG TPA: D-aminoacyl-tRNA deacylase [Candidatus Binataceae bacterium]
MRAILQRVSRAQVCVAGKTVGGIGAGFVVLLGVAKGDTEQDAAFIADRTIGLRVFADSEGKMNLAIDKVGGEMLVISQFTLLADTESGRRPSFAPAAQPEEARHLYENFISIAKNAGVRVEQGEFGASMEVELVNDGPVTIILDSRNRR